MADISSEICYNTYKCPQLYKLSRISTVQKFKSKLLGNGKGDRKPSFMESSLFAVLWPMLFVVSKVVKKLSTLTYTGN